MSGIWTPSKSFAVEMKVSADTLATGDTLGKVYVLGLSSGNNSELLGYLETFHLLVLSTYLDNSFKEFNAFRRVKLEYYLGFLRFQHVL